MSCEFCKDGICVHGTTSAYIEPEKSCQFPGMENQCYLLEEPEIIYLEPHHCGDKRSEGRTWCKDDVFRGECDVPDGEDCAGCKTVKYIRSDVVNDMLKELEKQLYTKWQKCKKEIMDLFDISYTLQPISTIKNLLAEFDKFAEETRNLPVQQEDEHKGQCAYNWHIDIVRRFKPFVEQVKEEVDNKSPWQPMDSAPRDSSPIILKTNKGIFEAYYNPLSGLWHMLVNTPGVLYQYLEEECLGWMPIPE